MQTINAGRAIKDVGEGGQSYEFIVPDKVKIINSVLKTGDEILIPLNRKKRSITFWESGGRDQNATSSIATIIANQYDELPEAILFNKLGKIPNGKQALVALRPGYFVYIGKINIRHNALAPDIKIVRLRFNDIDKNTSTDKTIYGNFTVDRLFTKYNDDIIGCTPGERLIDKLYTKDAIKPYFTNGWSISNLGKIKDLKPLRDSFEKIVGMELKNYTDTLADRFLDKIELDIVTMKNPKLSAVLQVVDFENQTMDFIPLKGALLGNLVESINTATITHKYSLPFSIITKCYNRRIFFDTSEFGILEKAFMNDPDSALHIKDRKWAVCRGFKG